MKSSPGPKALFVLPAVLLAIATFVAPPASGQTTTAQVRGTVTDAQGPIPAMPVIAVNTATGARFSAATATNGGYVLVLPAATYELSVSTGAHAPWKRNLQVGVGQSLTLDVALQPASIAAEVAVVATAAEAQVERVTSEVATNVSEIQIQSLPQSSRNFLNFAALAPGVRLSRDELRQEYSYGAQGSSNTNVFIDGTSYKNDVLLGGAVGQDASRGNP
ncbi:MAG TPA: carboxypeptidase-like regulatory domain-containing protein, partial [Thermoanaerobaculia bacterium]|nr:carboxypeptidase-like regulatory domain-containing protein [Thermoanaerobaculia bacterium]